MPEAFDVVIATDLRFPGGSSGSTLEEVRAQQTMGWRTGLYHLPASVLHRDRPFHPSLCDAMLDGACGLANLCEPPIRTNVLVFRHPSVIPPHDAPLPAIEADHVVLICNHPPINARGRIDYILPYARRRLRESYGTEPRVYPIGPLVREKIEHCYDGAAGLEPSDWSNIFDTRRFYRERVPPKTKLRIGRHSRPGPEKWPDDPDELKAIYPERDDIEVHILGGADAPASVLGYRPRNWTVHVFGAMPVEDFLGTIDTFVYYHHPNWTEAFGRVIAEAMASGLPTILPPHFAPLFKDAAIYAEPHDVQSRLNELMSHPANYVRRSMAARRLVETHFSHESHIERMMRLGLRRPLAERASAV